MGKFICSIIFFIFVGVLLQAQPLDTVPVVAEAQTKAFSEKGFFTYDELGNPIPKKSLKYSLFVPGMGQAYNKRWWKVPLVFGALGGIVYAIDFNQSNYRDLRDALELRLQDEPHQFSGTAIDNENSLRSLRDNYDRLTQLSYMGAIAVYGVIAIEAFIDGHLQSFDISDDLSLDIQPSFRIDPVLQRPTVGVGIQIQFTN